MSSYLVTGAGRGLGLELVTQLHSRPSSEIAKIFATTRSKPSKDLQSLIDRSNGRVIAVSVQITDKSSLEKAVNDVESKLDGKGLDVLINNAGIMPYVSDGVASMDNLREAFEVNVEAVHNTMAAFLPLLRKGTEKKVVNISTTVGSISKAKNYTWAPAPAYKVTKAALNMLTVQYAQDYDKEGFTFIMVSPGWLKTDMGSDRADLDLDVGGKAVLDVVFKNGHESNGKFLNIHVPGWENAEGPNQYDGKEVPW